MSQSEEKSYLSLSHSLSSHQSAYVILYNDNEIVYQEERNL